MGVIDGRDRIGPDRAGTRAVREEVELFGGPDLVFGCRHVPVDGTVAGVVVCSPLPYQSGATHLPEARLGRALARAGMVVQRFHYRGTGHSDGDPAAQTLESMAGDARDALAHLRHRTGVETVGLLGTAAGATVAALVARDLPGAPLALWDPFEPATPDRRLPDILGPGARHLLVSAAGLGAPGSLTDDLARWRGRGLDVAVVPTAGRGGGADPVEATVAWFARCLAPLGWA